MKLLISAYACAPNRGSEHGVGWNWTTEARRLGHEVWALVSPAHRDAIENAAQTDAAAAGVHWIFPELGFWPLKQAIEPRWERTYNLLWQRAALIAARELQHKIGFDVIHHLTWGGVRAPTFLGALGAPLIIGPIGGGETSPRSLRDGFNFKAKILERVRDLSNATIHINPLLRHGLANAAAIFVKTPDTQKLLNSALSKKATIFIELGIQQAQIGSPRLPRQTPPRLLYAGRLLYWKGVHIVIQAFAQLLSKIPNARLTIIGGGPEETRLKADASACNVSDKIDFMPWVSQNKLFELYACHDLLLFPSLHDSSGGVVLEALSHGLPVVCLALGGPKEIVTPSSGLIIRTAGLNTSEVATRMAAEICDLLASPARLAELSAGAISRVTDFILSNRVANFYSDVFTFVEESRNAATAS